MLSESLAPLPCRFSAKGLKTWNFQQRQMEILECLSESTPDRGCGGVIMMFFGYARMAHGLSGRLLPRGHR